MAVCESVYVFLFQCVRDCVRVSVSVCVCMCECVHVYVYVCVCVNRLSPNNFKDKVNAYNCRWENPVDSTLALILLRTHSYSSLF